MIVPTEADPASFCRWRMVWQKPHELKQLFLSSETACFGMVQVGEVVDSNGRWARNMLHVLLPRKPTRFGVSESWDVVGLFAEWLGWWTSSVGYQAAVVMSVILVKIYLPHCNVISVAVIMIFIHLIMIVLMQIICHEWQSCSWFMIAVRDYDPY